MLQLTKLRNRGTSYELKAFVSLRHAVDVAESIYDCRRIYEQDVAHYAKKSVASVADCYQARLEEGRLNFYHVAPSKKTDTLIAYVEKA